VRKAWRLAMTLRRRPIHEAAMLRNPETVAVRLGKLFGDGPGVLVPMQAAYDKWNVARK
jgi:antitoxin HigA-1